MTDISQTNLEESTQTEMFDDGHDEADNLDELPTSEDEQDSEDAE